MFADLYLKGLRDYRRENPARFNLALYNRYLPVAYGEYRRSEVEGKRVMT